MLCGCCLHCLLVQRGQVRVGVVRWRCGRVRLQRLQLVPCGLCPRAVQPRQWLQTLSPPGRPDPVIWQQQQQCDEYVMHMMAVKYMGGCTVQELQEMNSLILSCMCNHPLCWDVVQALATGSVFLLSLAVSALLHIFIVAIYVPFRADMISRQTPHRRFARNAPQWRTGRQRAVTGSAC